MTGMQTNLTRTGAAVAELRAEMARRQVRAVDLAKQISRGNNWLYRRLNGEVSPSLEDLELISTGLDLNLTDLLAAAQPDKAPAA